MSQLKGVFNDSLSQALTGSEIEIRATSYRGMHVNLRNNSGTEIGTVANPVQVAGSLSIADTTDEASWTAGTSTFKPMGGVFNDSATALTSGQQGTQRSTANRALHVNLRDHLGNEVTLTGNSLNVNVTNGGSGGTSSTDEAAFTAGTTAGTPVMGVFNNGLSALTSGQLGVARMTSDRALYVQIDNTTLAVTQSGGWTVTANAGTNLNTSALALDTSVNGLLQAQASTTSGEKGPLIQGAVTTSAPSYTTAQTNPLSLDTSGNLRVLVGNTSLAVTGTFWQSTQPVSGTVTAKLQDGSGNNINSTSNALNVSVQNASIAVTGTFWQATQPISGTVTANQGGSPWSVQGDAASGASVAGNPLLSGARAATAYPTAVTDGQAVALMADKAGRLIANLAASRDLIGVQTTAVSGTSETTIVPAGGSGVFNDILAIWVTNTNGTNGVTVTIKDGTGGTTRFLRNMAAASDALPIQTDVPFPQASANANWTATCAGTSPAVTVTVLFVKNK